MQIFGFFNQKAASAFACFVLACHREGARWIIAIVCANRSAAEPLKPRGLLFSWASLAHVCGYFSSNPPSHGRVNPSPPQWRFFYLPVLMSAVVAVNPERMGLTRQNTPQTDGNGFLYFACRCRAVDFSRAAGPRAVIKKHVTRRNTVTHWRDCITVWTTLKLLARALLGRPRRHCRFSSLHRCALTPLHV